MLDYVISFVAPLAYFLFFNATLVQLTRKSFGKCLPISMMLSAFLLFFSQLMFGTFWVGFIIGILFAIVAVPLLIIRRKKWQEFRKLYFTAGMVTFLLIYIGVYIFDLCRGFSVWDEFMHWGMMVKEMARLDKIYTVDASNLMVHKDYPPIMQLFELFWTKLCGGFNEACVTRALHTFELSLVVPFIAEKIVSKKDCWKNVLAGMAGVFSTIMVILLFDTSGTIGTIYTDYVMALIVAYLLLTILINKKITWFEIFTIVTGGSFLLLLKQMGLPLYLMVLCFLIGILWLRKQCPIKKYLMNIGYKKNIFCIVALLIPFVLWFIWSRAIDGISQQFELSSFSIKEFAKILLGRGELWQSTTVNNYTTALTQSNITTSYIQMSYVQSVVLFIGLMYCVYKIFKMKDFKKEMLFLTIIVVIGSIGYAVTMLLLYTSPSFGEIEGPKLASYSRYMGTFSILMISLVVFITMWYGIVKHRRGVICLVAIIGCLMIPPEVYALVSPKTEQVDIHNVYELDARKISDLVPEDKSVYLLAQEREMGGGYNFFVQYYATPRKFSWKSWDTGWPTDSKTNAKKYYEETVLPEMIGYDYMLVVEANDKFTNKYCDELKICPVKEGDLYKIVLNDDGTFAKYEFVDNIKGER